MIFDLEAVGIAFFWLAVFAVACTHVCYNATTQPPKRTRKDN